MFGVGFTEILLILLVTLIVFGPEKIPEVARDLARIITNLKHYSDQIKQEIGLDEFTRWRGRNNYYADYLRQTSLTSEPLLTQNNSKINNRCEEGALLDSQPSGIHPPEDNMSDRIIPDEILPKQKISDPSTNDDGLNER